MNVLLETSFGYKLRQVCDFLSKCCQTKPSLKDFQTEWHICDNVLYGIVIDQEVCDRIVIGSFKFNNESSFPSSIIRFSGISPKALSDSLSNICKSGGSVSIRLTSLAGEKRGTMTIEKSQKNTIICKTILPFDYIDNEHIDISNLNHVSQKVYSLSSSAFSNMCREFKNTHAIKIKTEKDNVSFSTGSTEYKLSLQNSTQDFDSVHNDHLVVTKPGLLTPWRKLTSNEQVYISLNTNNMYIVCQEDWWKLEMCCRISQ